MMNSKIELCAAPPEPWRVFVCPAFGRLEHSYGNVFLLPLLDAIRGKIQTEDNGDHIRNEWVLAAKKLISPSEQDDAHVAILPIPWSDLDKVGRRTWCSEVERLKARGLPVLGWQGLGESRPPRRFWPDVLIQHSSFRSEKGNLVTEPGWKLDVARVAQGASLERRALQDDRPVVTFRANMLTKREPWLSAPATLWSNHRFAGRRKVNVWFAATVRWRSIDAAKKAAESKHIELDLEAQHLAFRTRVADRRAMSFLPYVQSILDSDYVLCSRGTENFSYRFWETLSAGRTPVLIDTGERLPVVRTSNLAEGIVLVKPNQLSDLGGLIREHFDRVVRHDPEAHEHRQRALHDSYLPAPFFADLLERTLAQSGPTRECGDAQF